MHVEGLGLPRQPSEGCSEGRDVGQLSVRPSSLNRGLIAERALHISAIVALFPIPAGHRSRHQIVAAPTGWRRSSKMLHPDGLKPARQKQSNASLTLAVCRARHTMKLSDGAQTEMPAASNKRSVL